MILYVNNVIWSKAHIEAGIADGVLFFVNAIACNKPKGKSMSNI